MGWMVWFGFVAGGVALVAWTVTVVHVRIAQRPELTPEGWRADLAALVRCVKSGERRGAVAMGDKLLAICRAPSELEVIHALLAASAEQSGEFEGCAEHARRVLACANRDADVRAMAARLAFCEAVAGRLEEAEHCVPALGEGADETHALIARAHAVIALKRGDTARLATLLAPAWLADKVGPRSRALFDAMRAHGARTPYRAPSEPVAPEVLAWVRRVDTKLAV